MTWYYPKSHWWFKILFYEYYRIFVILHYIFSFGKRKRGLVLICFFICLGFLLSHCMNTAGFLTNYIILSLHVVWTISPNTVWLSVQNYKYSIFNFQCLLAILNSFYLLNKRDHTYMYTCASRSNLYTVVLYVI